MNINVCSLGGVGEFLLMNINACSLGGGRVLTYEH